MQPKKKSDQEDMKKLEPSYFVIGIQNGETSVDNSLVISQKSKHRITILSSNSTPRYIPQEVERKDFNKYIFS